MELERLIKLLKEHKVDYVIIGATAFPVYGYVRATLDVDIFIRATNDNVRRCYQALNKFGYNLQDLKIDDFLNKKILIRQYTLEVDIHPFVKGVKFEKIWKNKKRAKIDKNYAYFASLKDLIKMKRAAARVKDKEDLKYLLRIQRRKKP